MDPDPRSWERAPTIRDVARRAEVGVGTVSRVLNDSPHVSETTRRRVRRTIDDLGYRRSSTARNLSRGRTQTIGVVAPFFTTMSVVDRLRGVVEQLRLAREYDLLLFDVETLAQRADAFQEFARRDRIDGLLVISLRMTVEEVLRLERHGMPVVLVDVAHPSFPHIVVDDVLGGELATNHLLAKGHSRIGFVGDAGSPFGFTSSERRQRGMARALTRAGVPPDRALVQRGPRGREAARESARRLLRERDRPTAIFAASDEQALSVLEEAAAAGLSVPDELAVIGFDDIEVAAPLGLTTVRQPLRTTGSRGIELLVEAIEKRGRQTVQEFAPLTVVERKTT